MSEQPEQETLPYPVLVAELEAALTRATADNVVLRARIRVRDQRIADLEQKLATVDGQES